MKYRVINSHGRYGLLVWCVPAPSGRSLLFCAASWRKAVAYALCRAAGYQHKDATAEARRTA